MYWELVPDLHSWSTEAISNRDDDRLFAFEKQFKTTPGSQFSVSRTGYEFGRRCVVNVE